MRTKTEFDRLIRDAMQQPFAGWDFSWLAGRMRVSDPSWDFQAQARHALASARAMLDLGTGGGERLAAMAPLPPLTIATESYPPNVPIAVKRLRDVGATVVHTSEDGKLPFADGCFDLILDRHEAFEPREVARVLRVGGTFLTQQVGGEHFASLNEALGAAPYPFRDWTLAKVKAPLPSVGLDIIAVGEEFPSCEFTDIGAIVYYLKATPWQIPDFSAESYRERLEALHERIVRNGALRLRSHLILVCAKRK